MRLKQAERLWILSLEDGDLWWTVNNPPWRLYEIGAEFTVTNRFDGGLELKDAQGRYVGWSQADSKFTLNDIFCD